MRLDVQLDLSAHLQRMLQQAPERIMEAVKKALIRTALTKVETPAKRNCPVDTGRLRASIHTVYSGFNQRYSYSDNEGSNFSSRLNVNARDTNRYFNVYVGTDVDYAPTIENGGSGRRARPFLLPAYESAKQFIAPNIKRELRNLFR